MWLCGALGCGIPDSTKRQLFRILDLPSRWVHFTFQVAPQKGEEGKAAPVHILRSCYLLHRDIPLSAQDVLDSTFVFH